MADLRRIAGEARERLGMSGQSTILFVDEIHRFNKAQQDVILPYVEDGTLVLIGATTENPSFEVVSPLLSRARVFRAGVAYRRAGTGNRGSSRKRRGARTRRTASNS